MPCEQSPVQVLPLQKFKAKEGLGIGTPGGACPPACARTPLVSSPLPAAIPRASILSQQGLGTALPCTHLHMCAHTHIHTQACTRFPAVRGHHLALPS